MEEVTTLVSWIFSYKVQNESKIGVLMTFWTAKFVTQWSNWKISLKKTIFWTKNCRFIPWLMKSNLQCSDVELAVWKSLQENIRNSFGFFDGILMQGSKMIFKTEAFVQIKIFCMRPWRMKSISQILSFLCLNIDANQNESLFRIFLKNRNAKPGVKRKTFQLNKTCTGRNVSIEIFMEEIAALVTENVQLEKRY